MVHDIGMGSGLAAIAAMQAGAAGVVGFDTDPFAAVAARLNAQANGIPTFPVIPDIAGQQDPGQDHFRSKEGAFIVLAGDVFYDDEVASRMSAALDSAEASAEPDCHILVGDIGRGFLPRHRLEPLACYPVRDVGDPPGAPAREGWVYHWKSAWTEPAKRKGRPKGRPS
jgi:predicted nicotinamide N-methyase